jgi:hypothetical protein
MKKEIIRAMFIVGMILVCAFVLAEDEPSAFDNLLGSEDGIVIDGVGHTVYRESEIEAFGGTDAISIINDGASFTDNAGNTFEHISVAEEELNNRFIFDENQEMVGCEFTATETTSYTIGGTTFTLNEGERVEFADGEITIFSKGGEFEEPTFEENYYPTAIRLEPNNKMTLRGVEIGSSEEEIKIFLDGEEHSGENNYVSIGENRMVIASSSNKGSPFINLGPENPVIEGKKIGFQVTEKGLISVERLGEGVLVDVRGNGKVENYGGYTLIENGQSILHRHIGKAYQFEQPTESSAIIFMNDVEGNNLLGNDEFVLMKNDGSSAITSFEGTGVVIDDNLEEYLTEPRAEYDPDAKRKLPTFLEDIARMYCNAMGRTDCRFYKN